VAEQDALTTREVVDPVCGMTITPEEAAGHLDYRGQTYYFCAASCLERFRATPEAFLGGGDAPAAPATHAEWTCPMHPEIVRDAPGACPICGMALEPRTAGVEEAPNPELVDMTRRFWTSAALALPLLVVAMGDYIPGRPFERLVPPGTMGWRRPG